MKRFVLGIDPGLIHCGYAVLSAEGRKVDLCICDTVKLRARAPLPERIGQLHRAIDKIVRDHDITELSLETPFLGKNAQNFLKLGYVRGILYLLADKYGLIIHEYAPRQVKQSVSGYGSAGKEQVAFMMQKLFPKLPKDIKHDATDALAIALCAVWHSNNPVARQKYGVVRR